MTSTGVIIVAPSGLLEEPAGSGRVAPWGDEHVDDLAELVDGLVGVAPPSGDLQVGLVDLPAITDAVAAGPGSLGQQGREALDPAVDGDVVDLDAAFGQQLLDVAVRQREAQVPAHRQHDHIGREAEASERSPYDSGGAGTASSHGGSLPALGSITADATGPPRLPSRIRQGLNVESGLNDGVYVPC
jgi:hypothetical protein